MAKNKLQDALDKMTASLKAARTRAGNAAKRASEMTGQMVEDLVTLAVTGAAGYANGYMANYSILGVDAALAVGLPLAIAGIAASMWGYPELGRWIGAAGKGFLGAYAFKRMYMAGWASAHPDEAKAGQAPSLRGDPGAQGLPPLVVDYGHAASSQVRQSERAYRT